jgi:predicted acylesterase/phospholipase RssA/CRP-like cAMP-binding protein
MSAGIRSQPGVTTQLRRTVERFFDVQVRADVDPLLQQFVVVELPGGEWLFQEGEVADSLYLIVRGRLQVWGKAESAETPRLLGELASGECVGEVGLLTGGSRTAGVRAIRDSVLLRLDRDAFHRLAISHGALVVSLAAQIAERLRDRTAAERSVARGIENLAVLPVSDSSRVRGFGARLAEELETHDSVFHVDVEAAGQRAGSSLAEWLHMLNEHHRFLVLEAQPHASTWSDTCRRQADVLVLVADAAEPPSAGPWAGLEVGDCTARRILVLLHPRDEISGSARWLDALPADQIHHVRSGHEQADLQRLARLLGGTAVGLVLGGGGARGFAHIGVLRALDEAGIPVDWLGGSSIGAVFAALRAFDWTPARVTAEARRVFVEENPLGDYTLPLVSLIRGRRLQRVLRRHFDVPIEDLPIPYFCVSSHLDRGEPIVHERGPLWRAIRASVALPGVLPPAVIDGHLAVDGALLNNLPVDVMKERPVGRVIGVDLSVHKARAAVEYDEVPGPLALLSSRLMPSRRKRRPPNIISLMMKASLVSSFAHSRAMHDQADLMLAPPVARFGLLDAGAFDEIVTAGYEQARERLASWKPPLPGVTYRHRLRTEAGAEVKP